MDDDQYYLGEDGNYYPTSALQAQAQVSYQEPTYDEVPLEMRMAILSRMQGVGRPEPSQISRGTQVGPTADQGNYQLPPELSNRGLYQYEKPSTIGDLGLAKVAGVSPDVMYKTEAYNRLQRIKDTGVWGDEYNRVFNATGDVNAAKGSANNAVLASNPGVSGLFDMSGEAASTQAANQEAANRSLAMQYVDPNSTYGYGQAIRGPFTYGTGGDTVTTFNSQINKPGLTPFDLATMYTTNRGDLLKAYELDEARRKAAMEMELQKLKLLMGSGRGGGRGGSGGYGRVASIKELKEDSDKVGSTVNTLSTIASIHNNIIRNNTDLMKDMLDRGLADTPEGKIRLAQLQEGIDSSRESLAGLASTMTDTAVPIVYGSDVINPRNPNDIIKRQGRSLGGGSVEIKGP